MTNWREQVKAEIDANVYRYGVHQPDKWGCIQPPFPLVAFMPQSNQFRGRVPHSCLTVLMPCHEVRMLRAAVQSLDHPAIAELLIHPDGLDRKELQQYVDSIPMQHQYKKTVIEHMPHLSGVQLKTGGMVGNIARVREELFKLAQTEYVMCFDSDDELITPVLDYALTALTEEAQLEVALWQRTKIIKQLHWITPDWHEFGNPITTRLDSYLCFRFFQTSCAVWRRDFLQAVWDRFGDLFWIDYAPVEYGGLIRAFKYLKEVNQDTEYKQMVLLPFYGTRHRSNWSTRNSGAFKRKELKLGLVKISDEAIKLFPTGIDLCTSLEDQIYESDQKKKSATKLSRKDIMADGVPDGVVKAAYDLRDYFQTENLSEIFEPFIPMPEGISLSDLEFERTPTADLLRILVELITDTKPEFIFEFGSGLSTLVMAFCLKANAKGRLVSLEHDSTYLANTLQHLERYQLQDYVQLINPPLVETNLNGIDSYFYQFDLQQYLDQSANSVKAIPLVFIDGPESWHRFNSLPMVYPFLDANSLVILDDANKPHMTDIIEEWKNIYSIYCRFLNTKKESCCITLL